MIGIQIITYLIFLMFLFGNVSPIRANWEPVPQAKRWDAKYITTYGWVANCKSDARGMQCKSNGNNLVAIMILLDLALALMPCQLIRTLHRALQERILVCSLMAMGLFATGIAGYKMTLSTKVFKGDPLSTTVELSLWNRLEELVGLTAACMPCLKSHAERFLKRIGVLSTNAGISRPSFVMSLEEQGERVADPSHVGPHVLNSLSGFEEYGFGKGMMKESKGSVSTAEVSD